MEVIKPQDSLKRGSGKTDILDRYLEEVKSIRPGDRIAIKAAYTRKRELRFDNRGRSVSVMAIKATGIVKENLGDGRHLEVDWTRVRSSARVVFLYRSAIRLESPTRRTMGE